MGIAKPGRPPTQEAEIIRLRRSLANLAAQSVDGWMTCAKCSHQWKASREAPPGELCRACEGNQIQADQHHNAELIQRFRPSDFTRPVTRTRHDSAQQIQNSTDEQPDRDPRSRQGDL